MYKHLKALGRDVRGATAIEYGIILALIAVAMIASLGQMAGATGSMWSNISTKAGAVL